VAGPAASRPRLYEAIVRDLRDQVRRGELAPGDRVPTEAELQERYSVSKNTVRKAVGILVSTGVLDTQGTRGTFVRERRPLAITATRYERERGATANDAYNDELEAQGRKHRREFSSVIEFASDDVAVRLDVEIDSPVVCRSELCYIDNRPNSTMVSYYPMHIAQGTEIATRENVSRGIIRVLKELGHEEVGYRDEVSPRMPTEEEERILQLGPGVPVLDWIRTAYSREQPVRMTRRVYAGDGIVLVYELGDVSAFTYPA